MNIRIPTERNYNGELIKDVFRIESCEDNRYRIVLYSGDDFYIKLPKFDEIKIAALDNGDFAYDPNFGDDRICECGHSYYRHFDSYEDMSPVGCKYCGCDEFKEKSNNG